MSNSNNIELQETRPLKSNSTNVENDKNSDAGEAQKSRKKIYLAVLVACSLLALVGFMIYQNSDRGRSAEELTSDNVVLLPTPNCTSEYLTNQMTAAALSYKDFSIFAKNSVDSVQSHTKLEKIFSDGDSTTMYFGSNDILYESIGTYIFTSANISSVYAGLQSVML